MDVCVEEVTVVIISAMRGVRPSVNARRNLAEALKKDQQP
jgi:hypothetical protein